MKFTCDNCGTRYSIPEERVAGKILKIRCKKCENIIVVKGESPAPSVAAPAVIAPQPKPVIVAPAPAPVAAPKPETKPETKPEIKPEIKPKPAPQPKPARRQVEVEWFYSKGGRQAGPVPASELRELIRSRVIGPRSMAWREGMEDWVRIEKIEEFASEIQATEEPEKAAPDAAPIGIFNDLLKDIDSIAPKAARPEPEEKALPVVREKPLPAREQPSPVQVSTPEEGLAVTQVPAPSSQTESRVFAAELVEEARRQAELVEEIRKSESLRLKDQSITDLIPPSEQPEPQARENTRIVILKAGFSRKARIKKMLFAAVLTVTILGGLTWLATQQSSLVFFKNIAYRVAKPELLKAMSPAEKDMTPEEREMFRKSMLGIQEQKAEEAKRTAVARRSSAQAVPGAQAAPPADDKLQGAYAGLGKDELMPSRIELSNKLAEAGIGSIGGAGLNAGGVGLQKRDGMLQARMEAEDTGGKLSERQVEYVVATNRSSLTSCYERHLKSDNSLAGKVVLRVEVESSGRVLSVKSMTDRIKGSMLEECMGKTIRKWQFPKFEGGSTTVELPFVLTSTM